MGQTVKPKNKTQASQAQPSGEAGNTDVVIQSDIQTLRIKLIQLEPSTITQVLLNSNITVSWMNNNFSCFFRRQILGKVPINYNNYLNQPGTYYGYIVELKEHPMTVVIEININ